MANESIGELIDLYFNKVEKGEIEFSSVRKELEARKINPESITIIVQQVDKQLIRANEDKASHSIGKNEYYGGIALAAGGAIFTIFTYLGIIDLGNYYIVAYGPVSAGLILAMVGKSKMRNNRD